MASVRFYQDPEFLRRQTALIFGGIVLLILFLFSPVFELKSKAELMYTAFGGYSMAKSQELEGVSTLELISTALSGGCVVSCLVMLFMYKNRKVQSLLAKITALETAAVPILFYFAAQNRAKGLTLDTEWGIALPILVVAMLLYADKLIKDDEAKVRAMNRFW